VGSNRSKRRITMTIKSPKNDTITGKVQKYLSKKRNDGEHHGSYRKRNDSLHSLHLK